MSDKNLRESTKKVRENQIKRSEIAADIKKQKKKSKALQKQIREEESVFLEEALQLAEYTVEHFETSSFSETYCTIIFIQTFKIIIHNTKNKIQIINTNYLSHISNYYQNMLIIYSKDYPRLFLITLLFLVHTNL